MRLAQATGLAMLVAAAEPLGAEELVVGLDGAVDWSNSAIGREDDFAVRAGPTLNLFDRRGEVRYDLRYRPVYEDFVSIDGRRKVDHFAGANLSWAWSDATQLGLTGSLRRLENFSRRLEELEPDAEAPDEAADVELERETALTGSAGVSLSHRFSPRWSGAVRLGGQFFEYQSGDRTNSLSLSGGVNLNYTISARDTVGLGFTVSRQEFDAPSDQADRSNMFYNGFGFWQHNFSPTLSLSLQAGPAWVEPDEVGDTSTSRDFVRDEFDRPLAFREVGGETRLVNPFSCPLSSEGLFFLVPACRTRAEAVSDPVQPFGLEEPPEGVPDTESGRLTWFAETRLSKRWKTFTASLGYRRSESTWSGQASTLLDSVTAQARWTPSRRWSVFLAGSWNHRESASDQEALLVMLAAECRDPSLDLLSCPSGDVVGVAQDELRLVEFTAGDDEIETTVLNLRVERQIGRRTTVFGLASWLRQESKGEVIGSSADFDRFRATLGLRYRFDPIHF